MSDYTFVKNSTEAINTVISDKEEQIQQLETEIHQLKQTRRMINTEFMKEVSQ